MAERAAEARRAAEKAKEVEKRALERPIQESRQRVLFGRALRNQLTGFWRNIKTGREMFAPYNSDVVQKATTAFLSAAERLLEAWGAYREGHASATFEKPEKTYLETSATLTEMHMVLESVEKLTGHELIQERNRLSGLANFPDQDLITPVMGGIEQRAEQLEAYANTSAGNAKISQAQAEQEHARIVREFEEQKKRRQQQHALEKRRAADRRAAATAERTENQRINKQIEMCRASSADPEARKILAQWGFGTKQDMLSSDLWREERLVDGPGLFKVNRLVVDLVASELEDLRKRQKAQAEVTQKDMRAKSEPAEEPKPAPPRYSGPSGFEL